MTDPYSYLVVFDLGTGEASTFWALSVENFENYRQCQGYKGQELELTWTTPHIVKPKPRDETPKHVIARIEDCDPSEVQKGDA